MQLYENLIFKGGGTKGSAYAGSLEVLEDLGLYAGIKRIGGTSTGAITSAVLATGGGSEGLKETIYHSDFRDFLSDKGGIVGDIFRSTHDYGLHTGNKFQEILKSYIKRFSGEADLTFQQLAEKASKQPDTFKNLTVIASNLTRQGPHIFNAERHPDLPIWLAVRASMSIPLLFQPVIIDDEFHVDGGLSWNYPIDLYDDNVFDQSTGDAKFIRNPATLGFFLEPHELIGKEEELQSDFYKIDSLKDYALSLGSFFFESSNAKHIHPEDKSRTVFIDDLGVSATDFTASKECLDSLIESGRKATKEFFSNNN